MNDAVARAKLPPSISRDHLLACFEAFETLLKKIGIDPCTATGADLQCQNATLEFLYFVPECFPGVTGVRDFVFDLSNPANRAFYPLDVGDYCGDHVVALVGTLAVDWTARQFDPKAPVPMLFVVPERALS